MSVPNRTLCSTLKGWKWGYLVSDKKKLEPREFPWQYHHHLVSFVMVSFLVPSLKNTAFPEIFFIQYFRYSDILYSVFYQTSWCHHLPNLQVDCENAKSKVNLFCLRNIEFSLHIVDVKNWVWHKYLTAYAACWSFSEINSHQMTGWSESHGESIWRWLKKNNPVATLEFVLQYTGMMTAK